jgi:H-type small acid-soluble spore protein
MDNQRAKEILNQTKENIQVLYNGSPVWIEDVNSNNTAEVTDLNNHNKIETPVNKLVEVNPIKKF